jgi:hypothetical protein
VEASPFRGALSRNSPKDKSYEVCFVHLEGGLESCERFYMTKSLLNWRVVDVVGIVSGDAVVLLASETEKRRRRNGCVSTPVREGR